jgi:hypothetical protein
LLPSVLGSINFPENSIAHSKDTPLDDQDDASFEGKTRQYIAIKQEL